MADFNSTIHIEDEFSAPLKDLTKSALESSNAVLALAKSLTQIDLIKETIASTSSFAVKYAKRAAIQEVKEIIKIRSRELSETLRQAEVSLLERGRIAKEYIIQQAKITKAVIDETRRRYAGQLSEFKKFLIERAKAEVKDRIRSKIDEKLQPIKQRARNAALRGISALDPRILDATISGGAKTLREFMLTFKSHVVDSFRSGMDAYQAWEKTLYKKIIAQKKMLIERSRDLRGNLEFDLKQEYGAFQEWKMMLPHRLEARKKNLIEQARLLRSNLEFNLKQEYGAFQEWKMMLPHRLEARKANLAKQARALKDNLKLEIAAYKENGRQRAISFIQDVRTGKIQSDILMKRIELENKLSELNKRARQRIGLQEKSSAPKKSLFKRITGSDAGKVATNFAKNVGKIIGMSVVAELTLNLAKKLATEIEEIGKHLVESINKSLNEINTSDKLRSLYGDLGENANERAYTLANEIGENAAMIQDMAAKAAYQGIGTDDFEQMIRLSDKISKLSPGESVESVAGNLMSNLKSGHDAAGMAQALGGGDKMERQLRQAGFERALNKGDVSKALAIAEKITEQAGLTDEKYQKASNSMSENYKKINNVINNIKVRLGEIYNRQLEPIVAKIREFVESKGFQFAIGAAEHAVKALGKVVTFFISGLVDNMKVIGGLVAVSLVVKMWMFAKNISFAVGAAKLIIPIAMKIATFLKLDVLLHKLINKEKVKGYLLDKAISFVKVAGPWVLAAAAIAGAVYGLHKFLGVSDSIWGTLAGGLQFAINCFSNLVNFVMRIPDKTKILGLRIKERFLLLVADIKSRVGELISWVVTSIVNAIQNSPLGTILEKLDIDIGSAASSVADWGASLGDDTKSISERIAQEIKEIEAGQVEYTDLMEGVEEAYKTNGQSVVELLKKSFNINKEGVEKLAGISTDTDKIRKMNEQEEELRWMKAFSDRQIMSQYNNMTSNSNSVTINGMSQAGVIEMGRRSLSTVPSRRAS